MEETSASKCDCGSECRCHGGGKKKKYAFQIVLNDNKGNIKVDLNFQNSSDN